MEWCNSYFFVGLAIGLFIGANLGIVVSAIIISSRKREIEATDYFGRK